MNEPIWIAKAAVLALHEEQLAEHGGPSGLRDEGLLDSALDRPKNQFSYGNPGIYDLASAYAHGIAKNHPFLDGNKRASFVVCETFLNLNDCDLTAMDEKALLAWMAMVEGEITEAELAQWLRTNSTTAAA
ncbi:MAG: type II toxin-antitoxin system death-on-curing family toxin [Methylovirgula sp.]